VSPSPTPPPAGHGPDAAASPPRALVVLLAGPSGSGKSHLAERAGLPTVCLDDFYKDGDDATLPLGELGIPDWDHPDAWNAEAALAALVALVRDGHVEIPNYEFARDRAVGTRKLSVDGAPLVVAEGIFAAELIAAARQAGILADAICLVSRPRVTFWRRLVRDLREGRKSATTLLRRGLALRRQEPAIVGRQVSLGATPVHGHDALRRLERLVEESVAAPSGDRAA
jgi:uridine kinase